MRRRPAWSSPRRSVAGATTSTTSCMARGPTCPGAWRSTAGTSQSGVRSAATAPAPACLGTFHPTFLYESLWCLLIAVVLVLVDRRFSLAKGQIFALYGMLYTVGRGLIEMLRIDNANHVLGLRLNVWTSVIVFAGAAFAFWRLGQRRQGTEEGAAETTGPPQDEPQDEPGAAPGRVSGRPPGISTSGLSRSAVRRPFFPVSCEHQAGQCRPCMVPGVLLEFPRCSRDVKDGVRSWLLRISPLTPRARGCITPRSSTTHVALRSSRPCGAAPDTTSSSTGSRHCAISSTAARPAQTPRSVTAPASSPRSRMPSCARSWTSSCPLGAPMPQVSPSCRSMRTSAPTSRRPSRPSPSRRA